MTTARHARKHPDANAPSSPPTPAESAEVKTLKSRIAKLEELLRFHTGLDVHDDGNIKSVLRKR